MSYVRIWVHLVFSTKRREALLTDPIRHQVQRHIMAHCRKQHVFLQAINGYTDHLHCLLSQGREQTIAQIAQLIKGESSYWINEQRLLSQPFAWQDDYYAVSVSESAVPAVIKYIRNQEVRHATQSFAEELEHIRLSSNRINRTTGV
jgi:putative transposase